jgi:hypothetical protein
LLWLLIKGAKPRRWPPQPPQQQLVKAPEALAFHIAGMLEDGEKIPKRSKLDDLAGDPNRENAVAFLVTTDFNKTKTVRVNVTARETRLS